MLRALNQITTPGATMKHPHDPTACLVTCVALLLVGACIASNAWAQDPGDSAQGEKSGRLLCQDEFTEAEPTPEAPPEDGKVDEPRKVEAETENPCPPGSVWVDGGCMVVDTEPECPGGAVFVEGQGCVAPVSTEPPVDVPEGFVFVPPGEFEMGKAESGNRYYYYSRSRLREPDELLHSVTLTRGVLAQKTEVTQGQWRDVMGGAPSYFEACGAQCPVERVNWFEALVFLNRWSEREGLEACYQLGGCVGEPGGGCGAGEVTCTEGYACREVRFKGLGCTGYRLPTESEWEYMTRAGTKTDTHNGDLKLVGNNSAPHLDGIAWYGGNSVVSYGGGLECADWKTRAEPGESCGTHPVGLKYPNNWKLSDTLGNVAEWVWDWYDGYSVNPVTDPVGPPSGRWRVVRGCAWNFNAAACRASFRYRMDPRRRFYFIGFRAVRSVVQ